MIEEIARLAMHMPSSFDELRIIASEHGSLHKADRAKIGAAADEIETLFRELSRVQYEYFQAVQHLTAITDQLAATRQREIELIETMAAMKRGEKQPEPLRLSVELGRWHFENVQLFGGY